VALARIGGTSHLHLHWSIFLQPIDNCLCGSAGRKNLGNAAMISNACQPLYSLKSPGVLGTQSTSQLVPRNIERSACGDQSFNLRLI
jgi:hypothetical protein